MPESVLQLPLVQSGLPQFQAGSWKLSFPMARSGTQYFRVVNLEQYQHYTKRSPPWIKLHASTLEDYDFARLQDASKMHLCAIWLLASRTGNKIVWDSEWVAKRINATAEVDLTSLQDAGFIELIDDASNSLATCKQSAPSETENRDREQRTERETERPARASSPLISPRVCPPGMKHSWCDGRMHVPVSLHRKFQRVAPSGFDLEDWYAATDEAWSDKPIGDDEFEFWRARWREKHGTTRTTRTSGVAQKNKAALDDWRDE